MNTNHQDPDVDPPRDRNWLEEILEEAKRKNWCTMPYCTTCGSTEFRNRVFGTAASIAGIKLINRSSGLRVEGAIPEEDIDHCNRVVAEAIKAIPEPVDPYGKEREALVTLMILIGYADQLLGHVGMSLLFPSLVSLKGSWAGKILDERQEQQEVRAELRRERMEQQQRARKLRGERDRVERIAYLKRQRENNEQRLSVIERFTSLSAGEKLQWMAEAEFPLVLDAIPEELIPIDEEDVEVLSSGERKALLEKLGQRRRGVWGRIRKLLVPLR